MTTFGTTTKHVATDQASKNHDPEAARPASTDAKSIEIVTGAPVKKVTGSLCKAKIAIVLVSAILLLGAAAGAVGYALAREGITEQTIMTDLIVQLELASNKSDMTTDQKRQGREKVEEIKNSHELQEHLMARLRRFVQVLDTNGDGVLSPTEVGTHSSESPISALWHAFNDTLAQPLHAESETVSDLPDWRHLFDVKTVTEPNEDTDDSTMGPVRIISVDESDSGSEALPSLPVNNSATNSANPGRRLVSVTAGPIEFDLGDATVKEFIPVHVSPQSWHEQCTFSWKHSINQNEWASNKIQLVKIVDYWFPSWVLVEYKYHIEGDWDQAMQSIHDDTHCQSFTSVSGIQNFRVVFDDKTCIFGMSCTVTGDLAFDNVCTSPSCLVANVELRLHIDYSYFLWGWAHSDDKSQTRHFAAASKTIYTNKPSFQTLSLRHFKKGCVNGHNIKMLKDKSVTECANACWAHGSECKAFEYGVAYGGAGRYQPRDCQLQSSSNRAYCNGAYHNLDLYILE